ncbi:sporulation integral membrane protein YtvI [Natroniella sulfidigena]|uniref:sporulation integral membrane protein YtvI n=1 Tax=Natroniella sulfidigena TaxID=723921 RepID=UPI00200B080A|nr:sporulation integral membrane protein YtvI [Natroniella sulfidigena]MCK8816494.1 sporulation integral membrane protein YtvI [Natroniella sulfidigena]
MKSSYKVWLILLGVSTASIIILNYVIGYVLPFIIAVVVASLIEPAVLFLEKEARFSRGIAVAIVLAIIIIFISLLLTISISRLLIELDKLVNDLPDYHKLGVRFEQLLEQNGNLSTLFDEWKVPETVRQTIFDNLQVLYNQAKNMINLSFTYLLGVVRSLPRVVITFFISFIATFFMSKDKELIIESCLAHIPSNWRAKIRAMQQDIISSIVGFIRAQLILITNTTIISIIGLLILRSNYAIVIGLVCGVLDLIPVIGPSLIFLPWAIYNLIIGNTSLGFGLLINYVVIAVVRQSTEAKIVGQNIGVHPLATLMALYLGVQFFGVAGFFIGPLFIIILNSIFKSGVISVVK